ncbi:hypothetical protein C7212DRAFT_366970 [Tuber magnatum]|uniref:RNase H type-1 domain-containing protein n=1 Tax=Tuber magnatum TaxID=42249 RepID=A0A317SBY7_9PEZI|nr:hypothetical protein C7212DRAFT_366970 [Tuber magnatum]
MDPKASGYRYPSSTVLEMKGVIPETERKCSAIACGNHHGHWNTRADISTTPSGFHQGAFHNYPEEDKIATNIWSIFPLLEFPNPAPNPESRLRLLQTSRDIYRTTPNGVRVKFADGSTQLQFPGRLYSSDICGLTKREKISPQKCTRYSASTQVTIALFRTPIRYPLGGQPTYDNVHSTPPNQKIHQGRNTLIVQCVAPVPAGGIYFGPGSQFNRTYRQTNPPKNNFLGAEIDVVKHTVRVAQDVVAGLSKVCKTNTFTKLVIMTSSERVVRGMTEFLSHWRRMNWRGLDPLFFPEVEGNKQKWESLDQVIGQAMEDGLEVDLWLVPEEEVSGASDLVKKSEPLLRRKVQNLQNMRESVLMAKEGLENLEK